jgi:hypothetical protein
MAFRANVRLSWRGGLPRHSDVEAAFRASGAATARATSDVDGALATIVEFSGTARDDVRGIRAQALVENAITELGTHADIGPIHFD